MIEIRKIDYKSLDIEELKKYYLELYPTYINRFNLPTSEYLQIAPLFIRVEIELETRLGNREFMVWLETVPEEEPT